MSAGQRAMMQKTANSFLQTQWAEGVSEMLAAKEAVLVNKMDQLVAALEADVDLPATDPDDRAEEIREGVQAIIAGEFPAWYVETYDIGNAGRLAAVADADVEDVEERMQGWIAAYRDDGGDALQYRSDYELVRMHVEQSFGVSLQQFAQVVHWPESQHERAIRRLLVGRLDAIEAAIDALIERAMEGDDA